MSHGTPLPLRVHSPPSCLSISFADSLPRSAALRYHCRALVRSFSIPVPFSYRSPAHEGTNRPRWPRAMLIRNRVQEVKENPESHQVRIEMESSGQPVQRLNCDLSDASSLP